MDGSDLQLTADWRQPAYLLPIIFFSALITLSVGRLLLASVGLLVHHAGLFSGTGPLAAFGLAYLFLLEIPGRKLLLSADAITIKSWFVTTTVAWADIKDVQQGPAGWMNVNRQLPVATRLVVGSTANTVSIANVFILDRKNLFNLVRKRWLVARARKVEATPP